ncbi:hypothetical protein K239x_46860 [Planctomycetes bacterium K23_9]|uniref:Uncharacterized protein n=1 Tax=Stieleria marina TaxID=1930275 RepID=A0A517NZX4_9BACT|nr:hypothetical protein K239x_46860 [Planctomycetes bacterium K23_9]
MNLGRCASFAHEQADWFAFNFGTAFALLLNIYVLSKRPSLTSSLARPATDSAH